MIWGQYGENRGLQRSKRKKKRNEREWKPGEGKFLLFWPDFSLKKKV